MAYNMAGPHHLMRAVTSGLAILGLALFSMSLLVGAAQAQTATTPEETQLLADTHAKFGLDCASCHQQTMPPEPVGTQVCMTCHGPAEVVIGRTADVEPNPHASHKGEQPCESCHKAHQPSVDSCAMCHQWGYKVP